MAAARGGAPPPAEDTEVEELPRVQDGEEGGAAGAAAGTAPAPLVVGMTPADDARMRLQELCRQDATIEQLCGDVEGALRLEAVFRAFQVNYPATVTVPWYFNDSQGIKRQTIVTHELNTRRHPVLRAIQLILPPASSYSSSYSSSSLFLPLFPLSSSCLSGGGEGGKEEGGKEGEGRENEAGRRTEGGRREGE
eukprot:6836946-Pyramimonas_sp.AAC.1